MRHLLVAASALFLSGCCFKGCGTRDTSYVKGAPATLKEAKALAHPPSVTVKVDRQTRRSGGGGCGHSPACIILLPVILYAEAFPETWDEVTVSQADGTVLLFATYDDDGKLLRGNVLQDDGIHEVSGLTLPALGQRAVLKSAHLLPLADGGVSREPEKLLAQHDFLADYRATLKHTERVEARGELIWEATRSFWSEDLSLAKERLFDPAEKDEVRAYVLGKACEQKGPEVAGRNRQLLDALPNEAGAATASAALTCADLSEAELERWFGRLASKACIAKPLKAADLTALVAPAADVRRRKLALEAVHNCGDKQRELVMQVAFGQPMAEEVLVHLFTGPDGEAALGVASSEVHRAGIFGAYAANGSRLARVKVDAMYNLSSKELKQLAQGWLANSESEARCEAYETWRSLSQRGTSMAALREVLGDARVKPEEQPQVDAALVFLGDAGRLAAASKGVGDPVHLTRCSKPEHVVVEALRGGGCADAELEAFVQARREKRQAVLKCGQLAK